MSEQQYDIIFRGDIVLGHQLSDVKLRMQQLFKADAAKIDSLFSGRPVPLKRQLDLLSAQKYRDALLKVGAQVDMVAIADIKPVIQTASLAVSKSSASSSLDNAQAESSADNSWSLAPVGAYLLAVSEQRSFVPHTIDTSALSLRPEGSNLLDASEQAPQVAAPRIDIDFDLADVGADLLNADEKIPLPLLELDLGDWDIADLGADLIRQDEKPTASAPPIDIPEFGLAPVGADLGQLKIIIKPLAPDISGMSLVSE